MIDYFVRKRKEKNITQKQLADITEINQGDISKIESGKM
ncbi:MAG: helix-turn-helix transcriptional regulator [Eubacterium sp.]|nr:helix-turn-helix transcriptional regulator [Eubacterium sp.]